MKIPSQTHRARGLERAGRPAESEASAEAKGSHGPAAEVQVSRVARAFDELRAPERPDAEKVERLRAAITRGELHVDPEKIAARMIEEEME